MKKIWNKIDKIDKKRKQSDVEATVHNTKTGITLK